MPTLATTNLRESHSVIWMRLDTSCTEQHVSQVMTPVNINNRYVLCSLRLELNQQITTHPQEGSTCQFTYEHTAYAAAGYARFPHSIRSLEIYGARYITFDSVIRVFLYHYQTGSYAYIPFLMDAELLYVVVKISI